MRFILAILFALIAVPAQADSIIHNFVSSASTGNEISKFDATGAQIDIHDGQIIQTGTCPGTDCLFTWVGTSYGCQGNPGFVQSNYGQWCGFYKTTSTDLKNWSAQSLIFPTAPYASECSPTLSVGGAVSCWNFRLIYNASSGLWVGWFHDGGKTPSVQVVTCTGLATGCTRSGTPAITTGTDIGSINLFVDTGGTAYIVFTTPSGAGSSIYVQQLNSTYTDVTGSAVNVGGSGVEQPGVFKNGSTYYIVYGNNCPYCNSANTTYSTASSMLGTWAAAGTNISTNSCYGQPEQVNTFTINGSPVYLYQVDQYQPNNNLSQGQANTYLEQLSFTGAAINNIGCNTTTTIANLTEVPNPVPAYDQGDITSDFNTYCDIKASTWRMQTFVPTISVIGSVNVTALQGAGTGFGDSSCNYGSTTCALPNGNLTIGLYNTSGGVPTTAIASATFTTAQVAWSGRVLTIPMNATVTPGNTYAIVLKGTNTQQCYGMAYNDSLPFTGGVEAYSTNNGSTWTTESTRSLKFYVSAPTASGPGHFPFHRADNDNQEFFADVRRASFP